MIAGISSENLVCFLCSIDIELEGDASWAKAIICIYFNGIRSGKAIVICLPPRLRSRPLNGGFDIRAKFYQELIIRGVCFRAMGRERIGQGLCDRIRRAAFKVSPLEHLHQLAVLNKPDRRR